MFPRDRVGSRVKIGGKNLRRYSLQSAEAHVFHIRSSLTLVVRCSFVLPLVIIIVYIRDLPLLRSSEQNNTIPPEFLDA